MLDDIMNRVPGVGERSCFFILLHKCLIFNVATDATDTCVNITREIK
ncbi:unknown [Bacteroides sp. CAG:661]|nr:unknown [Bacteroides sp. CAG:661]